VDEPLPQTLAERWRQTARRLLPRAVLFIGIALIAVHVFRSRPSAVEVVYEYGGAQQGLVAAQMTYWLGGEMAHRLKLDYRQHPAGATQKHTLKLRDGDYEIELILTYAGDPPSGLGGQRSGAGKETKVTLRRPLLVHGSSELHVYVKPSRD
jgi:hypothetical protein